MGIGSRLGRGDGHRVRLRCGDGVRVADAARHRHPAPEDDARLVPESDDRLLPDAFARLVQRPLPLETRQEETLYHSSIHWHYPR